MSNTKKNRAGSEAQYGPRPAGEVLHVYLEKSNEPLAAAYRKREGEAAEGQGGVPQPLLGIYPHTEPCVDLKLLTRKPGRMEVGEYLDGVITHDDEDHFTFIQNARLQRTREEQRNPQVYQGTRINVHRKADGTLYPTFNRPRYTGEFDFIDFCLQAAQELLVVTGLVEE